MTNTSKAATGYPGEAGGTALALKQASDAWLKALDKMTSAPEPKAPEARRAFKALTSAQATATARIAIKAIGKTAATAAEATGVRSETDTDFDEHKSETLSAHVFATLDAESAYFATLEQLPKELLSEVDADKLIQAIDTITRPLIPRPTGKRP